MKVLYLGKDYPNCSKINALKLDRKVVCNIEALVNRIPQQRGNKVLYIWEIKLFNNEAVSSLSTRTVLLARTKQSSLGLQKWHLQWATIVILASSQ